MQGALVDSAQALPAAAPAMRVAPVVQPAFLPFTVKGQLTAS